MEINQGEFSWMCGGEFSWGCSCTHGVLIDGLNLLFIISLSLFWIIGYFRKQFIRRNTRTDWFLVVVSVCCAVNAVAHFSVSLWGVFQKDALTDFNWPFYFIKGLIWIFVSLSLIMPLIKWARILTFVWWISFSLLNSIQYVEILVKQEKFEILDIFSWSEEGLSEPLLTAKDENNISGVGNANLFSKLTFSWLNSLMCLGHSKPLTLEDIPNLVPKTKLLLLTRHSYMLGSFYRAERAQKMIVIWFL
ncbi:hypothetical protein MKW92_047899, partial [Papaver armeniacum]